MTTAPPTTRDILSADLGRYIPKTDVGISPGSERWHVVPVTITSSEITGSNSFTVDTTTIGQDMGIVGYKSFIKARVFVTKNDETGVSGPDIKMRTDLGALLFDSISMSVNGNESFAQSGRYDGMKRHLIDRYFSGPQKNNHALRYKFIDDDESFTHQPGNPIDHDKNNGPDPLQNGIANKLPFDIIRTLDDMPLMGYVDAPIPGYNTLRFSLKSTSVPSTLFDCDGAIIAPPRMFLIKLEMWFFLEHLEPSISLNIKEHMIKDGQPYNTDEWQIIQAPEPLLVGATSWNSGNITYTTFPDFIGIAIFPSATLGGIGNAYKNQHRYLKNWQGLSQAIVYMGGNPIRTYTDLSGVISKGQFLHELSNLISIPKGSGFDDNTSYLGSSGMDINYFLNDGGGTGMIWMNFRNFNTANTFPTTPISLTINMLFADPAFPTGVVANCNVYVIAKMRKRYRIRLQGQPIAF